MGIEDFKDGLPESAYSQDQISRWLGRIQLPASYTQSPQEFPKTEESLRTLMRCQITTFPYENLSVHYSETHLVDITPESIYRKLMGPENGGRGGYCMELSIFFYHMLRGLGFHVYMTGIRNRTRTNGVPGGEYQGWTHINNIVHLPSGDKFSVDVAFGGDGPINPLPMVESGNPVQNLGAQQVRLVHETIPKQGLRSPLWIYQYRNGTHLDWNSFYSFAEIEFFQEDFEVMNWFASAKTLHRWNVIVVRFLREGEDVLFDDKFKPKCDVDQVKVVGKVMLVSDVIKVNLGGKTNIVHTMKSETERIKALRDYFGIRLRKDEEESIRGWDMALK
ncbi:unnamed protein product [Clonostachys solani]|uniref:Arylamine N-acetyltransferase n=1 Tax=Clonostachys solani TaxID=160281 RepID=A0A9N9W9U8_9HYPO|nr:unnamed protein product [Clonostachys solani]